MLSVLISCNSPWKVEEEFEKLKKTTHHHLSLVQGFKVFQAKDTVTDTEQERPFVLCKTVLHIKPTITFGHHSCLRIHG